MYRLFFMSPMGSDLENFSYSLGSSGIEKNVIPADAGIQDYLLSGFMWSLCLQKQVQE